jgi:hypothetical protein
MFFSRDLFNARWRNVIKTAPNQAVEPAPRCLIADVHPLVDIIEKTPWDASAKQRSFQLVVPRFAVLAPINSSGSAVEPLEYICVSDKRCGRVKHLLWVFGVLNEFAWVVHSLKLLFTDDSCVLLVLSTSSRCCSGGVAIFVPSKPMARKDRESVKHRV